jgi:hypothetical protein
MKLVMLGGAAALALTACGALSDQQYRALEQHAEVTVEVTGDAAFCDMVEITIEAGGMKPPLAYPVDVLQRYDDEHC